MTSIELLDKMNKLLSCRQKWNQGSYCKDFSGNIIDNIKEWNANHSFCILGASVFVDCASSVGEPSQSNEEVCEAILLAISNRDGVKAKDRSAIARWQDRYTITFSDIQEILKDARKLL